MDVVDEPGNERSGLPGNVAQLFEEVRSRLVETGTRNRLVHVNRANTRGNVLNIVNEQSDEVYRILASGRAMRFKALGRDKIDVDSDEVHLALETDEVSDDRRTDLILETRLGPDSLQKKLLKIHREAQTAEEESGVNLLYLALGFLSWFEDPNSDVKREAPLVLVPVELVRNAKTSAYDIRARDDEFPTNLPLQQRLKGDFGIELPDLEITENWKPSDYFAEVAEATSAQRRWSIDPDAIQLGFFSFSKLLMYRDLNPQSWPAGELGEHDLVKGLLYEGFDEDPPLFPDDARLDEILPPEQIFHIVDADASQAIVIEEVRKGRNLIVQGPPGTGKSQTITNIIAAAVNDGKRVLFVAEKMAALSVVHDRLVKAGLRDVCLELHSRSANKKAVLAELAHTLKNGSAIPSVPGAPEKLREARDRLNAVAIELHRPIGNSGETGYSVLAKQSRLIGIGAAPPTLDGEPLAELDPARTQELRSAVESYASIILSEGNNPFEGAHNLDLQPVDLARLEPRLSRAEQSIGDLLECFSKVADRLGVQESCSFRTAVGLACTLGEIEGLPNGAENLARRLLALTDINRIITALGIGARWREARSSAESRFIDHAFEANVAHLRGPMAEGAGSFFARLGSAYRRSSRELTGLLREPLPKRAADRLSLVDELLTIGGLKRGWENDREYLASALGDDWRGDQTDFAGALCAAEWVKRANSAAVKLDSGKAVATALERDTLGDAKEQLESLTRNARESIASAFETLRFNHQEAGLGDLDDTRLDALRARLFAMANSTDRYSEWTRLAGLSRQLRDAGLEALKIRIDQGELDAGHAVQELDFARAEALWNRAIAQSDDLRMLGAADRHELVRSFAELERTHFKDNVTAIRVRHLDQLPRGAMGEMKVIRGEIGKKRAHIALRRLFKSAGQAIQRIKPVLLMSPISVAQFLPPGTLEFDILVIDEASQVRPEDALGAIARTKQIVVVGDKKQLPPSSFFDRLMREEDETGNNDDESNELLAGAAQLGALESVLTLCEARGLGSRMLSWHYRSRDPSLIQVSNREFYGDGLILPPSPYQHDPAFGMCFSRVDGVYDRGGRRDNRKEGEAVVARVAEHAKSHPDLSLGIVTFSFAQRNLITELLEVARRQDSCLDAFLREGKAEDLFVKNIENVQGDERDVILVSVGYGPSVPGGKLASMSFGPVNGEGGERRLNVLFTRARVRCEIFASFDPGDIDLSRAAGDGPRILKRFLEFARSGELVEHMPTGEQCETPFEQDVSDVIRSMGYFADPQVGSAGFRIDIGVRHPDRPGRYIVAVECDGATYHGALWARERDRLRQDVLAHLGWRFHRIWSTDWFYRRAQEIDRLRNVLSAAHASDAIPVHGANNGVATDHVMPELPTIELDEAPARKMPRYSRATPSRRFGEPHEASLGTLVVIAKEVIEREGPIAVEEIARRIATAFGKEKAGGRILAATRQALRQLARREPSIRNDRDFWFTADQERNPPVRDREAETGATLKAASISLLEIRAAIDIAREDSVAGSDEEIIRAAARLLGFRRVGPDLRTRLAEGL